MGCAAGQNAVWHAGSGKAPGKVSVSNFARPEIQSKPAFKQSGVQTLSMSMWHAVPGKAPGKVPVHYFGTQDFAWLRPSEVCSFQAGLDAGLHICKARNRSKPAFKKALHEVHIYFLVRRHVS